MKQSWKRLVALAAVLTMLVSVLPVQWGTSAYAEESTVKIGHTTADEVFLRKQAGSDDYWFRLPMDFEVEILGETTKSSVKWYKVRSEHPTSSTSNTYIGYIHSDYFALGEVSDENNSDVDDDIPVGEEDTSIPTGKIGEVNTLVNFRKAEGGEIICELPVGTQVDILVEPEKIDESHWYKVLYDGQIGYIMAPYLNLVESSEGGAGEEDDTPGSTGGTTTLIGEVNADNVNLRKTEEGALIERLDKGTQVEILESPEQVSTNHWYKVKWEGHTGYIMSVYLDVVGVEVEDDDTVTLTPLGYMKTVKTGVNLRATPAGRSKDQIKKNTIVVRLSNAVTSGGNLWFLVDVNGEQGYMRSDCVAFCDASGNIVTAPEDAVTPDEEEETPETIVGYVRTIKTGVNLRKTPAGDSQEQIAKGKILPLLAAPVDNGGKYLWYLVKAESGRKGYLRSDCIQTCTSDGTATKGPDATDAPVVTPGTSLTVYGYAMIKADNVNFRKTPGGTRLSQVHKNTVWPMWDSATTSGGYTWYPIVVNGDKGYVRGDFSFKLSPTQEASYLAGKGVPEEDASATVATQYVQTILDEVNLRASASKDASAPYNVKLGTVMAFTTSVKVGTNVWYKVIYDNKEVWVIDYCVKVMTTAEYDAYLKTNPSTTPQTMVIDGYIKVIKDDVNVRKSPGSSSKHGQIDSGVILPYSTTDAAKNYLWYYAKTSLGMGWIREDCVELCDKDGKPVSGTVGGGTGGSGSGSGQEATYTTLSKGSTGTAVKNLVTELKLQGYYTGEITSTYTSAVKTAVEKFQKAKGLSVDGIAGPQTQHALYGTVPAGSGTGDLTMTIYPAEKIDWEKGGIQKLWAKGSTYKVYDVYTGIVWQARRWSGAYHADVEPLTAADSARLCKIYGTKTTQQIWDDNLWERRPSLVTIGSRTFACSLYGMPHNYPDGDTIPDNDMKGQICIHFTNSKIHKSSKVDTYHQKAIEYAYSKFKNGVSK